MIRIKVIASGVTYMFASLPNGEVKMLRLASILYSVIATSMAGIGVIVVLVAGYDTLVPILVAAAIGAVVALPVSWAVARQMT